MEEEVQASEREEFEENNKNNNDSHERDENSDEEEEDQRVTGRTKLQKKFHAMTTALCDVVNDYNLVSFYPLHIEDISTAARVLAATDKANGFRYIVSSFLLNFFFSNVIFLFSFFCLSVNLNCIENLKGNLIVEKEEEEEKLLQMNQTQRKLRRPLKTFSNLLQIN